ncbi:MAG: hypothetical protein AAB442_01525 [Patescibacteria group bacterium]
MPFDFITELILQYRYWILIPLTFLEGPVIAFIAGTFASVGFFDLYALAILFFVRDVGLDGICYAIGYFGGRTTFSERMLTKIGITDDHLSNVRRLWEQRPFSTMFIGKLSYGIAAAFIVVAGMVRMPIRPFFFYGSVVAVLQYGTLLFAGYFLGSSLGGSMEKVIHNVQYVVLFTAIALSVYYLFGRRMREKFLQKDKEIEEEPVDDETTV